MGLLSGQVVVHLNKPERLLQGSLVFSNEMVGHLRKCPLVWEPVEGWCEGKVGPVPHVLKIDCQLIPPVEGLDVHLKVQFGGPGAHRQDEGETPVEEAGLGGGEAESFGKDHNVFFRKGGQRRRLAGLCWAPTWRDLRGHVV